MLDLRRAIDVDFPHFSSTHNYWTRRLDAQNVHLNSIADRLAALIPGGVAAGPHEPISLLAGLHMPLLMGTATTTQFSMGGNFGAQALEHNRTQVMDSLRRSE